MASDTNPALLLILDGWGHSENTQSNAIWTARTPNWDRLWQDHPHTLIHTSGPKVGLPEGQMGNSEVGHMNLGAGRVVYQNFSRINQAIKEGSFFENPVLIQAVDSVIEKNTALHIIGLLSPGGIHSHEDQIEAMIDMAIQRGCTRIYLHALLDGRDTPPRSATSSVEKFETKLTASGCGQIASIAGRFYGMDRDNHWDRIEKSFNTIGKSEADFSYDSAGEALAAAYARDESDEFIQPSTINAQGNSSLAVRDSDSIIFMNFRADRARELTRAFVDREFSGFARNSYPKLSSFVMLTKYAADIEATCAFPSENLSNVLGEYLASKGKTQLRIAETEKYAHVTFFFSGGREKKYAGESRILVPSPRVDTYDLKPEMSVYEVTEKLLQAILNREYDMIICNFANADMVGHTGIFDATVKAVETIDECLGKITAAILEVNGDCLITADHGNVEQMVDEESGQAFTAHTNGPVPLVYVGNKALSLKAEGSLSDISPSLLSLMGLEQPDEMTACSLIQFES